MRDEIKFTTGFAVPPKRSMMTAILIVAGAIAIGLAILFYPRAPAIDSTGAMEIDQVSVSNFDLDQTKGTVEDIPKWVRELDGKRVRFVARIWGSRDDGAGHLSYFQATNSQNLRSFNPHPPLAQDFWDCEPVPGAKIAYYDDDVRITGTFHIRIRKEGYVLKSVFAVDVDQVLPVNPNSNAI